MTRPWSAKYAGVRADRRRAAAGERGELYGRVVFFAVILGVFSSLWRAAARGGHADRGRPEGAGLVPGGHRVDRAERAADPRGDPGGDPPRRRRVPARPPVVVRRARRSPQALGVLAGAARRCSGVDGVSSARSRSPAGFRRARALAVVVPFGVAAAALLTALHLWIGLLAFWLGDVSPVYWVCAEADVRARRPDAAARRLSAASCSESRR